MVSALDPRSSSPGSRPGWGSSVVFLGKSLLYSHSASLHSGVKMGTGEIIVEVTLQCTSIPSNSCLFTININSIPLLGQTHNVGITVYLLLQI